MANTPRRIVKMLGPAVWCGLADDYRGKVTRGILREDTELAIDLEYDGRVYSVKLRRREANYFEGGWSLRVGATVDSGSVSAKLYTSPDGDLLLGEWSENSNKYHWWAELAVVTHFPDESARAKGK